VRAVFTPGASAAEIVQAFAEVVGHPQIASSTVAPSRSLAS
jgi:hypothetical protein